MLLCCSRGTTSLGKIKMFQLRCKMTFNAHKRLRENNRWQSTVSRRTGEMEEAHREINFSLQFLFCRQRHRYRWLVHRERELLMRLEQWQRHEGNNFRVCSRFFTRFSLHFSVLSAATWKETFLCASALKKWTEKAFQLSLLTAQLRYVLKVRFLTCCFVCCLFQRARFAVKSVGSRNVERWNIFKVRAMFWWRRKFVAKTRGGRKFFGNWRRDFQLTSPPPPAFDWIFGIFQAALSIKRYSSTAIPTEENWP